MTTNKAKDQSQQTPNRPSQNAKQAGQAGQPPAPQTRYRSVTPRFLEETIKQTVMEALIELNIIPQAEKRKTIKT